ncbi:MAG: endonuclease/exonuclease/phosphatase family protein [Deltaproteobacteria bacterium]|nr:endonuclease/exonuclease/phosphatase family protein [Deltaproteobacteria bacterium]
MIGANHGNDALLLQIAADKQLADERRERQARAVRAIVRARFPGESFETELFAVVGDLNDQPGSRWLRPLVTKAGLHDALADLPAAERWTHWWKSENRAAQLDYLLLSPALRRATERRGILPRIERGGIGTRGKLADGSPAPRTTRIFRADDDPEPERIEFQFPRMEGVVEEGIAASDHCPVFLEVAG